MANTIFIAGISGYIGGQVLHDITKKHPEYQIRGLVRTAEQQKKITTKYPSIQVVIGDLDSAGVLKAEATQADVILQLADADHSNVITTLIPSLPKKSTYIQLSGTASVSTSSNGLGQPTFKIWSDITDLAEITTFDHSHWHAVTDQLVLSEGKKHGIRTAVVGPPGVYGTRQGEIKRKSMAYPWYVEAVKKRGGGFKIGEGKNINSNIHVRDVAAAFILLVEEALKEGGKADWGEKGWYYVENWEAVSVEVLTAVVKEMMKKGMISGEQMDALTAEEAKQLHPYADLLWGSNMRVNGERIRGLGWTAKEKDVFSTISELLAE